MSDSSSGASARPRQTTFALFLVIFSAVVAVLTAWETMTGIGSLDTREMLAELLNDPVWESTGLTLAQARTGLHVAALITGAGSAAALILGAYCFRGDRVHRLALTLIAVPVAIAGLLVGGFATTVMAVSAFMLWLQPSRAWFNGEPIPEPVSRSASSAPESPAPGGSGGTPPGQWAAPDPTARLAGGDPAGPGRPPLSAVRAAVLSGVFASGTLLVLMVVIVMLLASPDSVMADLRAQDPEIFEQGLTEDQMVAGLVTMLGMLAAWCAGALALAVLVLRGHEWARICLVISAGLAGLLFALTAAVNPLMLVGVLACAITVLQLARPETARWTKRP